MSRDVLVVVGAGAIGTAITQRVGPGCTVLLADVDETALASSAAGLHDLGLPVSTAPVDVTDSSSVGALAEQAASLGPVRSVVHTAGVSPEQSTVAAIVAVDVVGVAHVLDAFASVVSPGGAGVVLASVAGHVGLRPITDEEAGQLASTPADRLATLPCMDPSTFGDTQTAYGFAKHANRIQVRAGARAWGRRGARLNSVSPGLLDNPMGRAELAGPFGAAMRDIAMSSPVGRLGSPYDIANAVAWLLSPDAAFVTGTDLLVDGGFLPALLSGAGG